MNEISQNATLWIFPLVQQIEPSQQILLEGKLTDFLARWQSHKIPVKGWSQVIEGRFVAIAGETPEGNISGCSIDSVFKSISEIAASLKINLGGAELIFYRNPENLSEILSLTRQEFAALKASGQFPPETVVFDLTVQELQALSSNRFEIQLKDSWMNSL